ncbi:uncharacterized protein LOC125227060 [Leguminivora glycinivorella]|uniref:uncharacterized protein LOC125227060 n=1 Tax=Leguminivora glycinivorella TaxID=1035111 RepID=UPI00200CB489|nr:uncharacterized protein LOC125227060 [Leguminivora glycinivorella]
MPTLDNFHSFLKGRADVLETVQRNKQDKSFKRQTDAPVLPQRPKPSLPSVKTFMAQTSEPSGSKPLQCVSCGGEHRIFDCASFKAKSSEDRLAQANTLKLCHNCLRLGHDVRRCRLPGSCRSCKQRHNTLLHQETGPSEDAIQVNLSKLNLPTPSKGLLATALVNLVNPTTKKVVTARCFLDNGCESSFITQDIKQRLGLTSITPNDLTQNLEGVCDIEVRIKVDRCILEIQSLRSSFSAILTCTVLPQITKPIPKVSYDVSHLNLAPFELADPNFNQSSPIDILVGSDLFWDILGSQQQSLGDGNPKLRSSKLGWIVVGPNQQFIQSNSTIRCNLARTSDLHDELAKFWELESLPHKKQALTEQERLCEQSFIATTERSDDGRFIVKLPLKDGPDCLGDSYTAAKKRFLHLERRFRKQPEVKERYSKFIHEYEELGHLSPSTIPRPPNAFFLPHHPVIKEKVSLLNCGLSLTRLRALPLDSL